jgi:NADPH:quinone reductase-like Zn-dependent oxidoreductase
VIHDNVGKQPLRRLRRALTPTGTLVSNAGGPPDGRLFGPIGAIIRVLALNGLVRQRLRPLPDTWTREHLLAVTELVEAGQVTPVVGRTYPLADTAAGMRYLEQGHARGKVVVTVT